MDWATYYPGGNIYTAVEARYGSYWANELAGVADSGDVEQVNAFLSDLNRGTTNADYSGSTSTLSNFLTQITTDPLAAPLESANRQLGRAWWNVLKSPWVLWTAAVVVFFALGGWGWLTRQMAKR